MVRASFWHSRIKLSITIVIVSILTLSLEYILQLHSNNEKAVTEEYLENFARSKDALEYYYDVQLNKAYIRHVVEKEQEVEEHYYFCNIQVAQKVKSYGWIENDEFHLYSAYLDERTNSLFPNNHAVQVLMMSDGSIATVTELYCNIMQSDGQFAVVKGYIREIWQRAWDPRDDYFYTPNLVTCPIPQRLRTAQNLSIALSSKPCKSQRTAIRVHIPQSSKTEEKASAAICVKGMDFKSDNSIRLVEWLELNYLLGADHVTVYTYYLSKQAEKVLKHYESIGRLTRIQLDLPGDSPNDQEERNSYIWRNRQQKRRHELIPYNDCYYRHLNSHRYVLIIDTDEVVVPIKENNYDDMLKAFDERYERKQLSSLSFRNVFKFPRLPVTEDVPAYMYMLKHTKRSRKTSERGFYGKSMTSTETVATVFNHFALHKLSKQVLRTIFVDEEVAVKLHYKEECPVELRNECAQLESEVVDDRSLDRFKDELTKRVEERLRMLKFIK